MKKNIFRTIALAAVFSLICSVFSLTAFAAQSETVYVYDDAYLLSDTQFAELTARAEEISNRYKCAVHIVAVSDADIDEYNIQQFSEDVYLYNSFFGYGADKDGFMLLVNSYTRCYWLLAYGDFGNYALTDYGKEEMSNQFIDNFVYDDWYGGFCDYLSYAETALEAAENGNPIDIYYDAPSGGTTDGFYTDPSGGYPQGGYYPSSSMGAEAYGIAGFAGIMIAAVTCAVFRGQMKTANIAARADGYVDRGAISITDRSQHFKYSTVSRTPINTQPPAGRSSGGFHGGSTGGFRGGTSVGSRGFSGRGGKF